MRIFPSQLALIAPLLLGLGACSTHDGYGYGGVAVGTGYARGYDDHWGYYSSRPYWGWYDNYYYPGTGYYVYDRNRRPHRWNDNQRRYWADRQNWWRERADRRDRREFRQNWRDFRQDRREWRDRRDDRRDRRRGRRN